MLSALVQLCCRADVTGFRSEDVVFESHNSTSRAYSAAEEKTKENDEEKGIRQVNEIPLSECGRIKEIVKSSSSRVPPTNQIVKLNVGGQSFKIAKKLLANSGSPVFIAMLDKGPGADGAHFLDRDASQYRHVLNFLRDGDNFLIPQNPVVRSELKHLGLARTDHENCLCSLRYLHLLLRNAIIFNFLFPLACWTACICCRISRHFGRGH